MLTIGKLAPGQQEYYLQQVALGIEEYYTGAKEAPGQWLGRGAERLELSGEVDAEQLRRLLAHVDPRTGLNLTGGRSAPKVAGFDATFSAPKSVSLLYALGDPETSNAVRTAHDRALRAAFAVYEDQASLVRRGHAGEVVQRGGGLVAAEFRHRTSRAGDPQLHTHVVVANVAQSGVDGRWSALYAHPGIYHWARPVGHLYQAQLRYELTAALGVDWTAPRRGTAEIVGFDRGQLRAFSHRRVEIEAHLEAHGETSAKAAQYAAYATRRPKDADATAERLHDRWRDRALDVGLDDRALAAVGGRIRLQQPPAAESSAAERLYRQLAGPEGLTRERSTFGRAEVLCALCDSLPHGAPVSTVLALAERFLAHPHVVPLPASDGVPVRWTTLDMLGVEHDLLARVERGRHRRVAVVPGSLVDAALAGRPALTGEQRRMVQRLCSGGEGIVAVAGLAGAGKTTALAAAVDAWTAAGRIVAGVALAARTAHGLCEATGVPATSIARWLHHLDTGRAQLTDRDVVIVDEAGMVGTRTLDVLAARCERAGAKLVLVGDPYQLPELTAGGAFAHLAHDGYAVALAANRRQREQWERDALVQLRAGSPADALAAYRAHDRIHDADTVDAARCLLVEDWYQPFTAGERVLMIAVTNRDVDALNQLARARLQADRLLGDDRLEAGGRRFAVGDRVMTLRNDPRLGVFNGQRGTITAIDVPDRTLSIEIGVKARTVTFEYLAEGGLTHGYAVTLHKAQGITVDGAYVLASDALAREHAYTAMSRGAVTNQLYVSESDGRADIAHAAEITPPLDHRLHRQLARSVAHRLAADHLAANGSERLAALAREEADLRRRIGWGPPDRARDLHAQLDRLRREHESLDHARQRELWAHETLERLGRIGRRLHPGRRQEADRRLDSARSDIGRHEHAIEGITRDVTDLRLVVEVRDRWVAAHQPDLTRLDHFRLERALLQADRNPELGRGAIRQSVERGVGLGL